MLKQLREILFMPKKLQGAQTFLGILIITQQDKNIPFFVKVHRFSSVLTKVHHCSLS
jgi:hypothetical protein